MPARTLPTNPSLEQLKKQARNLLRAHQTGEDEAISRVRERAPKLADASDAGIIDARFALLDAQRIVALEYGFDSWAALAAQVERDRSMTGHNSRAPSIPRGYATDALIAYFEAVRDRNVKVLRRILDEDPSLVDARIWFGHLQSAQLADELRANPYPDPSWNVTALHGLAVANFWTASEHPPDESDRERTHNVIQTLIDFGADVNALGNIQTGGFLAPIALAAWEGDVTTMKLLIDNGADISGEQAVNAMRTAATHDCPEKLVLLEECGANVPAKMWLIAGAIDKVFGLIDADQSVLDATDDAGYTLVTAALTCWSPNYEVAEKLVQRGAQVDVFSATKLDLERLQDLLNTNPALANACLADGITPLWLASNLDSPEAVRILLNRGADPLRGSHPLFRPAMFGYVEVTRLLLEGGCPVRDRDVACARGHTCLQLLLEHGGDPNDRDGTRAALHSRSSQGNIGAVDVLLDAGADPNIRELGSLETPLHFSTEHADVAERLLSAGADPALKSKNGETPVEKARREGNHEVVPLLRTKS